MTFVVAKKHRVFFARACLRLYCSSVRTHLIGRPLSLSFSLSLFLSFFLSFFPGDAVSSSLVKEQVLSVSVVERDCPKEGVPQILLVKRPETVRF